MSTKGCRAWVEPRVEANIKKGWSRMMNDQSEVEEQRLGENYPVKPPNEKMRR